jgi:hypothetical protein
MLVGIPIIITFLRAWFVSCIRSALLQVVLLLSHLILKQLGEYEKRNEILKFGLSYTRFKPPVKKRKRILQL